MARRSKIVCTLGPASDAPRVLAGMVAAGMDVARLNFSHGTAADHIKRRCGLEAFNQTSADGRVTLKEGECMGACGDAPVMIVDNKRMCSFMSDEKLDRLVEELKK